MILAVEVSLIDRSSHNVTDVVGGLGVGAAVLYAGVFITRVFTANQMASGALVTSPYVQDRQANDGTTR